MGLLGKYQIIRMVRVGETKTYLAEETATHRSVYIHQIVSELAPADEPDLSSLVSTFLQTAPMEESRHFLDMGEDEGRVCIITTDAPQCLDLRRWLQGAGAEAMDAAVPDSQAHDQASDANAAGAMDPDAAAGPAIAPVQPSAASGLAAQAPGEFTQMFFGKDFADEVAAELAAPAPATAPATPAPMPAVDPIKPAPPTHTPTGFEAVFHATSAPLAASPLPAEGHAAAVPPAPADSAGPGEFTRMFMAGEPAAAPAQAVPTPGDSNPASPETGGEKKRAWKPVFSNIPQPSVAPPMAPNVPPAVAPPVEKGPSEFTLMMQGHQPAQRVEPTPLFGEKKSPILPTAATGKGGAGEFTQMFQSGAAPQVPPPSLPEPPAAVAPPAPAPEPKGPGEFTQMFNSPPKLAPPPPAPVAAAAPPAINVPPALAYNAPAVPTAPLAVPVAPPVPYVQAPAATLQPVTLPQPGMPSVSASIPVSTTLPSAAVPQSIPASSRTERAFRLVLIISGCAFIAAVAMIMYFALRH